MRIGAAVDPSKQMTAEPREELCREGERPGIAAVRQVLEDLGEDVAGLEGAGRTDPAMIRALLRFQADTAIAPSGRTDRATRRALCAAAPPEGRRLERFPEYERLLADGRLEMTIAHGFYDEDAAEMARSIARLRAGLAALGFRDGPDGTLLRSVQIDGRTAEVRLRLLVPGSGASPAQLRDALGRALAEDEVVCTVGHARYGTGPDFDAIDSPEGNFVIDRRGGPAGHPHPPLTTALRGAPRTMLRGVGAPANGYQLLYFQGCTTENYLPMLRDPRRFRGRTVENTDVVVSSIPMRIATAPEHVLAFVSTLCRGGSLDAFLAEANARERAFVEAVRARGIEAPDLDDVGTDDLDHALFGSGFLDNRRNRFR